MISFVKNFLRVMQGVSVTGGQAFPAPGCLEGPVTRYARNRLRIVVAVRSLNHPCGWLHLEQPVALSLRHNGCAMSDTLLSAANVLVNFGAGPWLCARRSDHRHQ